MQLNGKLQVLPLNKGNFSVHVTLSPGSNSLLLSARDAAGNIGTTSYSISYEASPSTADQPVASKDPQEATPSAEPSGGTLEPSQQQAEVPSASPQSVSTPVVDQQTPLLATAPNPTQESTAPQILGGEKVSQVSDALRGLTASPSSGQKQVTGASSSGRQILAVLGDSEAPVIRISSPSGTTVTRGSSQTITGSVSDNVTRIQSVTLSVNGESTNLPVLNGRFKGISTMREGSNALVVTAKDKVGNEGSATTFVVMDTTAPAVSFTSPSKPWVNEAQQIIVGTVGDNVSRIRTVAFKLNGREVSVPVSESGLFSQSVRLNKGKNLVEVKATDEAGNKSTTPYSVVLDTVAPSVTLQSPPNQYLTNQSPLTFSGKASDNQMAVEKIVLQVKDWTKEVPVYSGSFSESVPLVEGDNPVVLTLSDQSGNTTTRTSNVTLDTVSPSITIDTPVNGSTVTSQTVHVTGYIQDNRRLGTAFTLMVNGSSSPLSVNAVGNFNAPVTLKTGANQITVTAVDAAGNVGTSTPWTISYQDAPVLVGNTALDGVVLEYGTEKPIAGVTVTSSTGKTTTTNAEGQYFLETTSGTQSIHIEDPRYTPADRTADCVVGQHVGIQTVYLTPKDTKATLIDAETGGTVVNSGGTAELVVPPGALSSDQAISLTIQNTNDDTRSLPGPLPAGAFPVSFADLQPNGLKFDKFVTLRLPNWRNLPPGTPAPCTYWDENAHVWAGIGAGAVSADGKYMEVAITHFTSYGFFMPSASTPPLPPKFEYDSNNQNANPTGNDYNGPTKNPVGCHKGSNVDFTTGNLSIGYRLKGLPSIGLETASIFTYNSKNRTRSVPFKLKYEIDDLFKGWRFIKRIDWELSVAGRVYRGTGPLVDVDWDTRDARGLFVEPGVYPVRITTTTLAESIYFASGPAVVSDSKTIYAYVRGPGSRYGSGWNFNYDQRLVINPGTSDLGGTDAHYWLTMPDGHIAAFTKKWGSSTITAEPGFYSQLTEVSTDGVVTGYTLTDPDQTRHDFDARGRLTSTTDRNGNVRRIVYDGELISEIVDSSGQSTRLEYDEQGKLRSLSDAAGRTYRFNIDANGFLASITDPLQHSVAYTYSPAGYLVNVTDERGNAVQYSTLQDGTLTQRIGPDGSIRRYDFVQNLVLTPTAGIMSKQVVPDDQGRFWFLSARPVKSGPFPGFGNGVLWFERLVNYLDKEEGKTYSFKVGEFYVDFGYDAHPDLNNIKAMLGSFAVDSNSGKIYLGVPGIGLQVIDSTTGSIVDLYPIADLKVDKVLFDSYRSIVWVDSDSISRIDLGSRDVQVISGFGSDVMLRKDAIIDKEGNIWKRTDRYASIAKISPYGQPLRLVNFADWNEPNFSIVTPLAYDGDNRIYACTYDKNALADNLIESYKLAAIDVNLEKGLSSRLLGTRSGQWNEISGVIPRDFLITISGNFWIDDEYSKNWYFCGQYYSGIRQRIAGESLLGQDFVRSRDYQSIDHSVFEPFVDNDGLFWLAGENFFFGLGNAEDPLHGRFTDSNGNRTVYDKYSENGGWFNTVSPSGAISKHQLNLDGERTYEIDPNGERVYTSVDAKGGIVGFSRFGKYGQVNNGWDIRRDPTYNFPLTISAPDQTLTTYRYDGTGNLIEVNEPEGRTTKYTVDAHGAVTSMTDPRGNVTRYEYNPNGTVSRIIRPDGKSIAYEYDSYGNPKQVIDANGKVIRYGFDALNRMTSVAYVLADGTEEKTEYAYEEGGECGCLGAVDQVASIKDAKGRVTIFQYDPNHNLKGIVRPDGTSEQWVYDGEKNLLSHTDANGKLSRYSYDAENRLVSESDPLGRVTQYEYDKAGYRTAVIDPKGNRTTYTYGLYNLLESITDAKGGKVSLGYDIVNRLTSIKDPLGKETTRTFDGLGRLKSELNSAYETTQFEYDSANNLVKKTDPKGQVANFEYDALDRLTRKVLADDTVEFAYDDVGNILSAKNKNGEQRYTYDARDRMLSKLEVESGRTLRYSYDKVGNLATMVDAEGKVTSYAYDALDRLKTLTFDPTGMNLGFGFEYDANGQRTKLTRPNRVNTSYSYDDAGQLLSIVSKRTTDNAVLQDLSYVYDLNGNRVEKTDANGKVTYDYDVINQLIQENRPDRSTSWEYDLAGNRLTETGATTKTFDYTGQAPNRLKSISDGTSYTYDPNGNTTTVIQNGVTSTYTYNADNQLEQLARPGQTWQYLYDADRTRIRTVNAVGKTTLLLNSGDDLIAEYDANGNLEARNVFAGLDEPLAWNDAHGNVRYYLQDGLGSIVSLFDANGSITDTCAYDAWGMVLSRTGNMVQPFSFTGREEDSTGLYSYRARYYNPTIGRFTQGDPIGFIGDVNFYRYVFNRPIVLTDPSGLIPPGTRTQDPNMGSPIGVGSSGGGVTGGFGGRGGAFNAAKSDLGIPRTQQPTNVFLDKFRGEGQVGQPQMTRVYEFKRPNGETVYIQDHWPGHQKGNQGPHFNVRPLRDGQYDGKGRVEGTKDHYEYGKNKPCPI